MIVVMKPDAGKKDLAGVVRLIRRSGFREHVSRGKEATIVGIIGDERRIDPGKFQTLPGVDRVMPVLKPFKLASRDFQANDSVIQVGGVKVGGGTFVVMAGPCAVESRKQILQAAESVARAGAAILRGGAFKPRTSPYSFQGLGLKGLKLLAEARRRTGLPVVTEAVSPEDVPLVAQYADIIQVGARNMQNFRLLEVCGSAGKPVLLKRGMSSTLEELLLAAEYILGKGNHDVVLCERGIRTFERYTRNTLDLSAVPVLKKLTHLPIIVDPSHATGNRDYIIPLARAAAATGADGLLLEVHPSPDQALCDGAQSLNPEQFGRLMEEVRSIALVVGKSVPSASN